MAAKAIVLSRRLSATELGSGRSSQGYEANASPGMHSEAPGRSSGAGHQQHLTLANQDNQQMLNPSGRSSLEFLVGWRSVRNFYCVHFGPGTAARPSVGPGGHSPPLSDVTDGTRIDAAAAFLLVCLHLSSQARKGTCGAFQSNGSNPTGWADFG